MTACRDAILSQLGAITVGKLAGDGDDADKPREDDDIAAIAMALSALASVPAAMRESAIARIAAKIAGLLDLSGLEALAFDATLPDIAADTVPYALSAIGPDQTRHAHANVAAAKAA